jgi:hypothetical protein
MVFKTAVLQNSSTPPSIASLLVSAFQFSAFQFYPAIPPQLMLHELDRGLLD